jgi:hypothetical protein
LRFANRPNEAINVHGPYSWPSAAPSQIFSRLQVLVKPAIKWAHILESTIHCCDFLKQFFDLVDVCVAGLWVVSNDYLSKL